MSDSIVLSLKNIRKSYADTTAVDNVSLDIKTGEFVSILGPSGCGKTTTLRMIGGFIRPDAGSIHIAGEDVSQLPPSARNTSMVFQDYALFPHMTIESNIAFGLKIKKLRRNEIEERIKKTLDMVGLSGYEKRKPSQLSGGQRQRVALARSLVLQPVVLLLDEPLGALDAKIRKQMQTELKQLQKELGQTFVYVTHDQEEAMTMSDRVAIMRGGRLEQIGSPEEVYDNPASLFVAAFLGECVTVHGRCVGTDGRFQSSLGTIEGRYTGLPFSGPAALCIRPENIVLTAAGSEPPGGDYHFPAVVCGKVFKGLNTQVSVECAGERLFAEIAGKTSLMPGDAVYITFSKHNALLLPDEDAVSDAPAAGEERQ